MLNDRELTIIEGVLTEIICDPDAWKTWGTMTVRELDGIASKLRMRRYCEEHGIRYKDLTEEDYERAYLEEIAE